MAELEHHGSFNVTGTLKQDGTPVVRSNDAYKIEKVTVAEFAALSPPDPFTIYFIAAE